MRIVGGSLGGRVLRAPLGARTRPTSDKVREAIFAILSSHDVAIAGARVLDLFAGSGALGIEALSRGAIHATFVDSGKAPLAAIRGNLAALELAERASVVGADALNFVARPSELPWQLVFIDPPYASELAVRAVTALAPTNLAPDATVVIEHDRRHIPPDVLGSLHRADDRRYGDTLVSFFTRRSP